MSFIRVVQPEWVLLDQATNLLEAALAVLQSKIPVGAADCSLNGLLSEIESFIENSPTNERKEEHELSSTGSQGMG